MGRTCALPRAGGRPSPSASPTIVTATPSRFASPTYASAAPTCSARICSFGGEPQGHPRCARVDEHVDREIFVLLEEAHEQALHAAVQAPVEDAQVVARDVVAVIGELDARAHAAAATLGAQLAQ